MVTDFDAKYASTLELVKGDVGLGAQLHVTPDADVLRERREDRRHVDAAVLRPGDRVRAAPRRVGRTLSPVLAIETRGLTKDYATGFWRKRPHRVLDALDLDVERGEVFGFLGPNGAGKTTTLKLLMQLVYPTGGRGRDARPSGRRRRRQAAARLPSGEPVLLRLPHRRRAARVLRAAVRLQRPPMDARAPAACSTSSASAPSGAGRCASFRRACCSASGSRRR